MHIQQRNIGTELLKGVSCPHFKPTTMKKETRGGIRAGAGRPLKEPTKIITFRVRLNEEERIRSVVKAELQQIKKEQAN